MLGVTIQPHCPWYDMLQTYGAPNVHWCEEIICSYINNPANTWTNIGYILAGIFAWKLGSPNQRFTRSFSLALIFTGLVSGFYHATNNYLTQFFDFVGMFTLVSAIICVNLLRMRVTKNFSLPIYFVLTTIFSLGFFYAHYIFPVQFLIVIGVVIIISQEVYITRIIRRSLHFKIFMLAMMLLGLAQFFSQLDLQRIWCDPTNHFIMQGHALWHLTAAIALYVYFLFVRRNIEDQAA